MAIRAWRKRWAPALLAALVLFASLASAAHAHPTSWGRHGLSAAPAAATAGDLDCALCATNARLSQGALPGPALPPAPPPRDAPVRELFARAPLPLAATPPLSRAPPRNG